MSSYSAGSSSKKPSGSFNRKRKLQHANEDEIQSKALQKFITASTSSTKLEKNDTAITANVKEDELPIPEAVTTASARHQINKTEMKEEREESDGEEMEHESGDSDKSTSSCDSSDTDTDDSSDMDIEECERRRAECMQTLAETERQIKQLTEQLYRERITQLDTKLSEVRLGRAQEYLGPLDDLQENCSIRIEVAGILRQYRLANIRNNFEAEEQAANQNYNSEKMLAMDLLKDEIEEKIRMLEEDRNNVDISADLWAFERSRQRRLWSRPSNLPEDSNSLVRRKPTVVTGPYIVYMLRDADILEDWAIIKKAATVCKRKSDSDL